MASALEDAYGAGPKPLRHSEGEILQASTERTLRAERHVAAARDEVEGFVRNGDVSWSSADAYLKDLSEWQDLVRDESRQIECHKHFAPAAPPLGWTLSKSNQALMRCLSIRQDNSEGLLGRSPKPPDWPSIWLLRYTERYKEP